MYQCKPASSPTRVVRFLAESRIRFAFQKDKRAVGKWMREELANLGPAYIKFGQFLSTRPDIVGKEVVKELELLQDDITQVPYEEVCMIIEDTLQKKGVGKLSDVFYEVDPVPIASASIGQVHIGKLRNSREKVAIKVQKPCVASLIRRDLDTLKGLNEIFAKTRSPRSREISSTLNQYEMFLSAELDFNKERRHMHKFVEMMEEGGIQMKTPKPIDALSCQYMLVMEYVPSTKINNVDELRRRGIDTSKIADTLIQAFLYQIITAAYVHCDPHPGNIGVMDDGETLVLYDYGNVVQLSNNFKDELNQIVFAMYQKDVDEFVDILVKLRILNLTTDVEIIEAKSFFMYFFNYLETLDFSSLRTSLTNGDFTGTLESKFKLDRDFFSLFRVFSLLDGTCSKLDPEFNYIDALSPFTDDLMFDMKFMDYRARKDFNKMRTYPSMLKSTDMNVIRMQGKMKQMELMQTQAKAFVILWIIIDNISEPSLVATFMGIIGAWWVYTNKGISSGNDPKP